MTINGVDVRTFTPDESGVSMTDGLVVATIPSASLSGVALDSSFPVTITATNDVTSRTSDPSTLCKLHVITRYNNSIMHVHTYIPIR